jgi:nicotinate phosphoribosyltransferase
MIGDRLFYVATEKEIKEGKVTDVYFQRVAHVLKEKGINPLVKGEIRANTLPEDWRWAVFAGLEELLNLMEGIKVKVKSIPEGTIFFAGEPVLTIEGRYLEFAVYETSFLGFLCQSSGVTTKAARCKKAAEGRGVYSFGARRMHPAIAPMIERNAFIGGCDGVAAVESAMLIGEEPIGTMSHSFILCMRDEEKAFRAFDEILSENIKRICLIDTFSDEKFGAIKAAKALGEKIFGVRLDTPSSRRGNMLKILEEVRWELDLRNFNDVSIFVSGGVDEKVIKELNPYADAYGVGTAISNAPVVDFSFDLIEIDGEPVAKRGKRSGEKQLYRCWECFKDVVTPHGSTLPRCPSCNQEMSPLLSTWMEEGKKVKETPSPREIRDYVLKQIENDNLVIE